MGKKNEMKPAKLINFNPEKCLTILYTLYLEQEGIEADFVIQRKDKKPEMV